jgi:hypothetical protein
MRPFSWCCPRIAAGNQRQNLPKGSPFSKQRGGNPFIRGERELPWLITHSGAGGPNRLAPKDAGSEAGRAIFSSGQGALPAKNGPVGALGGLSLRGQTIFRVGRMIFQTGKTIFRFRKTLFRPGKSLFQAGQTIFHSGKTIFRPEETIFRAGKTLFRSRQTFVRGGKTIFRAGKRNFHAGQRDFRPPGARTHRRFSDPPAGILRLRASKSPAHPTPLLETKPN